MQSCILDKLICHRPMDILGLTRARKIWTNKYSYLDIHKTNKNRNLFSINLGWAELFKNKTRVSYTTILAQTLGKVDRLLLNNKKTVFTKPLAFIYTKINQRISISVFDLLQTLGIKSMTGIGKLNSKLTKNKSQWRTSLTKGVKLGIK